MISPGAARVYIYLINIVYRELSMPDYDDTSPFGDTQPGGNFDPLGIMGWVIGGKYKIQAYLGGGGFGEVYEAHNENLPEQRLVIKFFKRVQAREKFAKEAKILCMLDHPNISRVIDYLPEEGAVVVAYIDGKDGGVILKESGALPEELFKKVARSISSAIAYAHEKKIAHRDIKPGNIIIDKNENVYLIDFGIAKEMGTEATKTAYTALTPMFAAPERQSGEKGYNPFLSDVYETGITLFNLATNSLPYRNPTNPLVEEWGGMAAKRLSPELTRILRKATHPEPARRYPSAAAMAQDLKGLKTAFGGSGKRSRLPLIAALIVILGIAGYLGRNQITSLWSQRSSVEERPAETVPSQTETESLPLTGGEETGPDQTAQTSTGVTGTEEGLTQQQVPEEPKTPEQLPVVVDTSTVAQEDKSAAGAGEVAEVPEEATEDIPEQRPEPPPPPKSDVFLGIIPSDSVTLTVGGTRREPGRRFTIDPGNYEIVVIHPDFPIYKSSLNAASGKVDKALDLADLSGTLDTIALQIALIPPTDNHILEFRRNGRRQMIYNFPFLGLSQVTGEWSVESVIKPIGAAAGTSAKVDSCIIFPFNAALRQVVKGNSGILKVAGGEDQTPSSARLLIYWSEN